MSTTPFAHLHNHTDHSELDGNALVKELAAYTHSLGQRGFSVTDHGVMSNVYNGMKAAEAIAAETGDPFNFVPGIEAYVAPADNAMRIHEPIFFGSGARDNKEERSNDVSAGGAYTHLTMLAETTEGMHNLFKLNSDAWKFGNYKKPRTDLESIAQRSNGIIVTTGCPSGELQTRLRLGQLDKADEYVSKMIDIFGRENYFVELMDHNMSINLERMVRSSLLDIAKRFNLPLLATNDLHYVRREDAQDQEHLLAIQSGSRMSERTYDEGGKRFAFSTNEYYAKSVEEMLQIFPEEDFPGAIRNSASIVERCTAKFEYDPSLRPTVDIPEGHDEHSWLRECVYRGLHEKRPTRVGDQEYIDRIEMELEVFRVKNFSGYMLVVADFCNWYKNQGWPMGPARGSGGGSMVAFLTGITEIDPIPHDLIFERFLNPERDSPPDIDSDFDDVHRPEAIAYVTRKYGPEYVSMIITFGLFKAKQSINDIVRIYDHPFSLGTTLNKSLPAPEAGKEISLAECYDPEAPRYPEAEAFRNTVVENGAEEIVHYAQGLEGHLRQTGVHAAGVIMSSKKLDEVIPMRMRKKDGAIITQFDYPTCEDLGLIKMDFLGLRNLTVIHESFKAIERIHGVKLDSREIYDSVLENFDEKTRELLNTGNTLGIFQLDSSGMASLIKMVVIDSFRDVEALLALYRPGPMGLNSHINYAERKNGKQEVDYIHPEFNEVLQPILGKTYGLCIYQEQIQRIAQVIAGYSLGQADILRRAMGKKKKKEMDAQWERFHGGAVERGYSDEAIQALWDVMVPFAKYGFNKSHSAGYALVSYMTAYLKANYPAEFMAANLSSLVDDKDKTAVYLHECKRMGIKVYAPDVSKSGASYTATENGDILVGLEAISGIGHNAAEAIHAEVVENGPYRSIDDFMTRAPAMVLSAKSTSTLSHAGAFDSFGYSRRALHEALPAIASSFAKIKKKKDKGQESLFDMMEEDDEPNIKVDIKPLPEYRKKDKLYFERQAIGLYVSDHPLSGIEDMLGHLSNLTTANIRTGDIPKPQSYGDRPSFTLAGVAGNVVVKPTRNGPLFATFDLEDITGSMDCLIFPKDYERIGHLLKADSVYRVTGNILGGDSEEESLKFAVKNLEEIVLTDSGKIPMTLNLHISQASEDAIMALEKLLRHHKGKMPVRIATRYNDGRVQIFELPEHLEVAYNDELVRDLREMFGVNAV